jgi:hypothetical protein
LINANYESLFFVFLVQLSNALGDLLHPSGQHQTSVEQFQR